MGLGNLPSAFQEVLTATVRVRSGSQAITDPERFRAQFIAAIKSADQEAATRGVPSEYVRLCTFATVAFLDESALNSQNPVFAEWPRRPLQEQIFGVDVAGEIFFRNLDRILAMPDSHFVADVLEVHLLCILLGFRGRFRLGGKADLRALTQVIQDRIQRIRGGKPQPPAKWAPSAGTAPVAASPWVMRLGVTAAACTLLAVILFAVFKFVLSSDASGLRAIAAGVRI